MEAGVRAEMTSTSVKTKNKKLAQVLENRDIFIKAIDELRTEIGNDEKSFHENTDAALVEGRDISVCIRVRPLMSHEESSGIFGSVLSDHPFVHTLEPKFDVRGEAKTVHTKFDADFVFGPEHDNDEVYDAVTMPLIKLGLKGM